MANSESVCNSCGKRITNITGTARFVCPRCAKTEIVRCKHCRQTAAKYRCSQCNFEGPN